MANVSCAYGELIIPAEYVNDELEEIILEFITNYESPYYGVYDWNEEQNHDGDIALQFSGYGRWTFESCAYDMERFFNVAENEIGKKLIKYFVDHECVLPLTYVDSEPGCEVLYEFCGEYIGDQLGGDCESFDYTSKNLVSLGFEDASVLIDDDESVNAFVVDYMEMHKDCYLPKFEIKKIVTELMKGPRYDGVLTITDTDYLFLEEVESFIEENYNECGQIIKIDANMIKEFLS